MDDNQNNTYRMYQRVEKILDDHSAAWSGHVAYSAAAAPFKANNVKIEKLSVEQAVDTTGYTGQRDEQKLQQAEVAVVVSGAIASYASVKGDEALAA